MRADASSDPGPNGRQREAVEVAAMTSAKAVTEWTRVDIPTPDTPPELELHIKQFASETDEAKAFLLEPLPELIAWGLAAEGWQVTTTIVGHGFGLRWWRTICFALVVRDVRTVALTIWKQDPGEGATEHGELADSGS